MTTTTTATFWLELSKFLQFDPAMLRIYQCQFCKFLSFFCSESDAALILRTRPVIDIGTWFGRKPVTINPDLYGCEGDVRSLEVCFRLESCFMIKNFPSNIDRTFISYRLVAEAFPGGRKVSRFRFGDHKSNARSGH